MIDLEVLKKHGLSNESLKAIFTAEATAEQLVLEKTKLDDEAKRGKGKKSKSKPLMEKVTTGNTRSAMSDAYDTTDTVGDTPRNPDVALSSLEQLPEKPTPWDVRRYWERRLTSRITDGLYRNSVNFNKWAAIDLAYASTPIHPLTLPLMRVAQGFINLDSCADQIAGLSSHARESLFEKDAEGKLSGIKAPQLVEVSHNLVHSLVTRRVAAIATEVAQQYPLMEYNPFSNSQEGKLRGDVMTQIAEQMAGAYGYRHDCEESVRSASLYSQCVKFKANAWHREMQTLPKKKTPDKTGAAGVGREAPVEYERQVVREGVVWTMPHPSRVYADIGAPMAKLNTETGPQYVGHWDVVRIGDLRSNPAYFNKDAVFYDAVIYKFFAAQFAYFSQYFPDRMIPPIPPSGSAGSLSLTNDRVAQIGAYASLRYDMSTTIAYHYEYIIPKDYGFGDYEDPVWIRFVVAGNRAVIYAEIVGSAPASVNAYNTSDNLLISPSFAMQVLPYQEQISNLLTSLLRIQYQGLVRMWTLNTHGMAKEDIEKVERALQYPDYLSAKDIILKYDAALMADRGQDPKTITTKLQQITVETREKVTEIFQSIIQLLSIAERLLFFSPQELGQVAPRTITASEAKMVNTTTLGIRDFHLFGIKQQLDADKRIIHDSYMAFGQEDLEVPVAQRYDPAIIEKAGFEIIDDGEGSPDALFTIRGKKLGLLYNYIYTTRNTDDLPAEAAEAQALSQIYDVISKDQRINGLISDQQLVDLLNRIFKSLTAEDFKIAIDPKMKAQRDAQMAQQQQLSQVLPQIQSALQGLNASISEVKQQQNQDHASVQALSTALAKLSRALAGRNGSSPPVRGGGPDSANPGANDKTLRGQIAPGFPLGSGAPALRVVQPGGPSMPEAQGVPA